MAETLVSIFQIAEHFGVEIHKIYNWISTKKMPAHLVAGKWMFDPQAIEAWSKEWVIVPRTKEVPGNEGDQNRSGRPS